MKNFEKRVKSGVREYQANIEEGKAESLSKEGVKEKNIPGIGWLHAGGSIGEYLKSIGKDIEEEMVIEQKEMKDLSEALSEDEKLLLAEKAKNMKKIGEDYRSVILEMKWLDKIEQNLLENAWEIRKKGYNSKTIREALQKLQERRESAEERLESNMQSNPEAWYVHHLLTLRGYKRALLNGELVKTPYVKKKFNQVCENIRAAQPVFIHGHLGSGKSQLAFQAATETYREINREMEESENIMEGFKETSHTVTDEKTIAGILQSHDIDARVIPKDILEKKVFEGVSAQIFTTEENNFGGVTVHGKYHLYLSKEKSGGTSEDIKDFKEISHTVTDEKTIADILQSYNIDTEDIPKSILGKQVVEGKSVQIFSTEENDFRGLVVDKGSFEENAHPFYRISGDENVTRSDFFGRYVLKGSKQDETLVKKIKDAAEKQFDEWAKMQDKETLQEKGAKQWDLILAEVHNKLDTGNTTEFEYGPVYKAMEEGKVLVIDEVNAIPHETLICLNDILASVRMAPGKNTVVLHHNGGKKVVAKPGFNIVCTGNLNTQTNSSYVGRKSLDPAFLNRFTKMGYDYVPQSTEGGLDEVSMEDELFHILLAMVMDRRGNIDIPKGSIEKIWELAKATRTLQESFSGKRGDLKYDGVEKNLEKNVPSIRSLVKVFDAWERDGYRHTLDYHLKKSFVNEIDDETTDKDFIEQHLRLQAGFFTEEEKFINERSKQDGGAISEDDLDSAYKEVDRDNFEFIYKEQVAEYAFGEAPEHTYADAEVSENAEEEKEMTRIEETISSIAIELQEVGCTV